MKRDKLFRFGIFIYIASAIVFLFEFIGEVTGYSFYYISWNLHELIEMMTFLGFIVGLVMIWQAHKLLNASRRKLRSQLQAASGAFQEGLESLFELWELSAAEREIALLTIKGMSIPEISELRQTSQGTIKAQSSAIYRKSGVGSRAQLVSLIIEELLN